MAHGHFRIAMLSLHSSPTGELGTRDTGGMSVYVFELAQELGARGVYLDIYTQAKTGHPTVTHLARTVRLIHLNTGVHREIPKQDLYRYLDLFYDQLEAFRKGEHITYDLIHSHYWLSGCLGLRAQRAWNVPHLIMFHTLGAVKNSLGVGPSESHQRIAAEQLLAQQSTAIVVGAEREKQHLIRFYRTDPKKILLIPCGVNLDRFQQITVQAARQQLGLDRWDRIVLSVGRLDPLKGVDRLMEAFAMLRDMQRCCLVIVGGGDTDQPDILQLRQHAESLNIHDRVIFAGRVAQGALPFYYSAADVVVIPSHYESFGLVVLEALACGTPVITTPVGAVEQILTRPEAGMVLSDVSPCGFASALRQFLTCVEHSPRTAAIRRALATPYSWHRVTAALYAAYNELLRTSLPSAPHMPVSFGTAFSYAQNQRSAVV